MTYMPADKLLLSQALLDRKFHEYKLAALTGILTNIEPSELTGTRPKSVAIISNAIARAMRDEDERAERGDT